MPENQTSPTQPSQQITKDLKKSNISHLFTNKKKLIFLLFGLIFFLLATSALTLRKPQTQPSSPTSQLEVTPTPGKYQTCDPGFIEICEGGDCECFPQVDETANWKTYRNEELGFEFKYPSDILIPSECFDGVNLYHADSKMPWSQYCNSPFITLVYSEGELSLEQLDQSNFEVTTEKMTVAGQRAVKQIIRKINTYTPGQDLTIYVQFKNDKYFMFTLKQQKFKNEFTQILSTFKFAVNRKVVEQKLPYGMVTECKTDSECEKILSYNNCSLYCINNNPLNQQIIGSLSKTCDATLWDPPLSLKCSCVENMCQLYE